MSLQSDLELLERLYAQKHEKRVQRTKAELEESELNDRIAVIEKRIEINSTKGLFTETVVPGNQDFIAKYREQLDHDDLEFLSEATRTLGEVVQHTGISSSSLQRLVKRGQISVEKAGSKRHLYLTASVMEYMLSEETVEES